MSTDRNPRKSWRQGQEVSAPSNNNAARWLLTVLAIGMVAVLIPILYRFFLNRTPTTQFIAVLSAQSRAGLPSLDHAVHDLSPFSAVNFSYFQYLDRSELLQSHRSIADLNVAADAPGILILFVSAHGVTGISASGSADLLCRDYDLTSPADGVIDVAELLAQLKSNSAKLKLLVIDSGMIVSDPRLGVFANEFPRRVAQLVEQLDDPNLWVMLSHSTLQSPLIAGAQPASLFGSAFTEGLLGKADEVTRGGNGDRKVTLEELYRYVVARCEANSGGFQTPLLAHASKRNSSEQLPAATLLKVGKPTKSAVGESELSESETPRSEPPASGPSASTTASGTADEEPGSALASNADRALAEGGTRSSGPTELDSTNGNVGAAKQNAPVVGADLWRLRDEIESLPVEIGWTPQEFAPHLWRRFVEIDLPRLANDDSVAMTKYHRELRELQAVLKNPEHHVAPDQLEPEIRLLVRAAESFFSGTTAAAFQTNSAELRPVADAVREVSRIAFLAPYVVRWHADTGLIGVGDGSVSSRIEPLLERLSDFQRYYAHLRGKQLPAYNEIVTKAVDVRQAYADLNVAIRSHIDAITVSQESGVLNARGLLRSRAMLASPLPTADERVRLQLLVDRFDFELEPTAEQVQRVTIPQVDEADRRSALDDQRTLEDLLIGLFDVDWAASRLENEPFGAKLRAFYAATADGFEQPQSENTPREWLPLVDSRDANRIGWQDRLAPEFGIDPPKSAAALSISADESERLEVSQHEQIVTLRVLSNNASTGTGTITLADVDPRVQIQALDGSTFQLNRPAAFRFRVQTQPGVANTHQRVRSTVFTAQSPGFNTAELRIPTWILGPNRVELVVTQGDRVQSSPINTRDGIELRPFPNRITPFRFMLKNLSSEEKTVTVSLYQVPLTLKDRIAPGRLFASDGRVDARVEGETMDGTKLRNNLQLVAASRAITLAVGGTAEPVDFRAQAPPDPPEGEKPVATSNAETNEESADVSHGLICEIADQASGDRWRTWIELRTLPPRDYVLTTVRYNASTLTIHSALKPGFDVPNLAEQPISLVWDVNQLSSRVRELLRNEVRSDQIDSATNPAELLSAKVTSPDKAIARIRLSIDDYPRAMAFDVPLDEEGMYKVPQRNLYGLNLVAVAISGHPTRYVTSTIFLPDKVDENAPVHVLKQRGSDRDSAAFPVTQNRVLELNFQVDAPVVAFARGSQDRVIVQTRPKCFDPIQLFADRKSSNFVESAGADGLLSLRNSVSDYTNFAVQLQGIKGKYDLQLALEAAGDVRSPQPIQLSFDDNPPRLVAFDLRTPRIEVGSVLQLHLEVADESGIAMLEYGISDRPGTLPAKMTPLAGGQTSFLIPTKGQEPSVPLFLTVKVTDRAGNQLITDGGVSGVKPLRFTLYVPKPIAGDGTGDGRGPVESPVVPGRVHGAVALGDFGPSRITVELTGGKRFPPVTTGTGGKFEFNDVPPGDYVLKASGNPLNRGTHVGETPIAIKTQKDFEPPVTISIAPKPN